MRIITRLLILTALCWSTVSLGQSPPPKPLPVSLIQLIATPDKFDGKLIHVFGLLAMSREGDLLYLDQADRDNVILSKCNLGPPDGADGQRPNDLEREIRGCRRDISCRIQGATWDARQWHSRSQPCRVLVRSKPPARSTNPPNTWSQLKSLIGPTAGGVAIPNAIKDGADHYNDHAEACQ